MRRECEVDRVVEAACIDGNSDGEGSQFGRSINKPNAWATPCAF